jgi:hypothetical protein
MLQPRLKLTSPAGRGDGGEGRRRGKDSPPLKLNCAVRCVMLSALSQDKESPWPDCSTARTWTTYANA